METTSRITIKNILSMIIACLLFFCVFAVPTDAQTSSETNKARTIRVGYFLVDGFQEQDPDTGAYSGYSYEFLMAIAAYGDWQYEFVPCANFAEAFDKLEKGEIDLLNDLAKTEGRNVEFTNLSAGSGCSYLLMHDGDNRVAYNDWEGMKNITIGLDKESAHSKKLISALGEHGITPKVTWYENEEQLITAWKKGEVDAFPAHSDTAIDGRAIMILDPRMYYLATTKGNTKLIHDVDYAIQALRANDISFEANLYNKYYSRVSRNYKVLTKEEQAYIKAHPIVRVLYVPDWYPLSYQDKDGKFTGPFKKIYDLIHERTGLQFEFVPLDKNIPFKNIVDTYNCYMLAEHPTDYTGASRFDVKLTQTFLNAPLVEVSKGTMKKGDTIALVKGDSLSQVAKRVFGDSFVYSMENSVQDCIDKVQNGTVNGTVLMSYEAEFYQSQRKYRNLIYTVVNSGSYGFALAVSNQADPLLYSIIVKGLNSITDGEVNNIFNQMSQELRTSSLWDTVLENPVPFATAGVFLVALLVLAVSGWYFSGKIKEKNKELIKANATTNQFFTNMSHDMRTPMNGILGIAELAQNDSDVDVLHEEMGKIQRSGAYLLSLINDTLDYQRIESGKLKIEKEIVDYRKVFDNTIELITAPSKKKGVNLVFANSDKMPDCYIWTDPVRLKQIFVNLLSNAVKFTAAGGTVTLEYQHKEQDGAVLKERFYVKDNGVGMSKEFIEQKMFKAFSQEHNEVTGQYAGSGLGLSIVKNIVDLMGGTISVESEVGKGTTFAVDIDFAKVTDAELKQYKEKEKQVNTDSDKKLQGVKVLLAEDHPLNAEISQRLLKKVGCEVTWVKDGQEAVNVYSDSSKNYFDIILMDIRMPIMNGFEATKSIRGLNREDATTIPIVAMTANAYESDVNECLAAGMNAHLGKPIDPKKLYAVVTQYCKEQAESTEN